MGLAFSDFETEQIHKALLTEARRCKVTLGMRKTSVDRLTQAVGISKGSFYRFPESKELLFSQFLKMSIPDSAMLPTEYFARISVYLPTECAAKAILAVCRRMSDIGAMTFIEKDVASILPRLPDNIKPEHYHDDETHIRALLEANTLHPKGGAELTAASVRGLILTISHKEQIGLFYPQVLDLLMRGACAELFS